jgi:D-lactate dehydrogenase
MTVAPGPRLRPLDTNLVRELEALLSPERVLARPIDRLGRSADASIYRLVPEAVVRPRDVAQMQRLLAYARTSRRHLTLRAAGTSLSGQAVTDDLLVELATDWRAWRVLDGGRRVWAQPAVVGGHLNRVLAPARRRIGPDPASIDAAMVGGILANNASGMCCGVVENSYRTLDSLVAVLADGTVVDTGAPDADAGMRRRRPDLHEALSRMRDEVRADPGLALRIRRKFQRKNTTGYSLNAFVDFDAPAQILAHLMVGSEGTLGFVSEATLRTVEEPRFRATALVYFDALQDAGAAVAPLAEAGAVALEIMDSASLRSQAEDRKYPFAIEEGTAALLAEFGAHDEATLSAALAAATAILSRFRLLAPATFTSDAAERERHWKLRKGLFPAVGAARALGTAVVIEDVAVPVERLAEAICDLKTLFVRHDFPEAIVFGHAKDGNLHFVLAQDFADAGTVARYAAFMRELVALVVGKYDGALKAEHGSGRNMAPFVRDEWGETAHALMRRVKSLLDPDAILNPGVILNDDPEVHLKALKALPATASQVDRCIECGFCEPRCPSRDLTLSPRQRIVVARAMSLLGASSRPEDAALRRALRADFGYEALRTCATDSMCMTSCPVKIDTGAFVKELRSAGHGPWARRVARVAARHMAATAAAARLGLRSVRLLRALPGGGALLSALTRPLQRLLPDLVPHVSRDLPLPDAAPPLPSFPSEEGRRVVYFPSCLTRILGRLPGEGGAEPAEAMLTVLRSAGFSVVIPSGMQGLCCGMPFASKGFPEAAEQAAGRSADALWRASREGQDPVVTDASPCAGTLKDLAVAALARSGRNLRLYDFPGFWANEVLSSLPSPSRRRGASVLHPTCTLVKMGGLADLVRVAAAHSDRVVVPDSAECCGFAGDRGFLAPELTNRATRAEAAEVAALDEGASTGYFSTCRTCELGMARATGRPYRSVVALVLEATRGA